MTHAALFMSAFTTVFLLGVQQLNVSGRHYLLAAITSLGIGAAMRMHPKIVAWIPLLWDWMERK